MSSFINSIFGAKKQRFVAYIDDKAPKIMEVLEQYYVDFQRKVKLFNELKELVISAKSEINKGREKGAALSPQLTAKLHSEVDALFNKLLDTLREIENFVQAEETLDKREEESVEYLVSFVKRELSKIVPSDDPLEKSKHQLLTRLDEALTGASNDSFGLLHLLKAQLELLHDLESAQADIEKRAAKLPQGERPYVLLLEKVRIIEIEIMRFGRYCEEEARIITHNNSRLREFRTNYSNLRRLGLVYSESRITGNNVDLLSMKLRNNLRGFKGVGIIHQDDSVELRFVGGAREKHAELLRVLDEGMTGIKLATNAAIKGYLHSLPLGKLSKVAGYQVQLYYDEFSRLKLANIDYTSTILEVMIEKIEVRTEVRPMSRIDFDRLNYTLLFSIDRRLMDSSQFRMNIEKHGHKITVIDERIIPAA